ncbi:hypothetical protein ACFWWS_38255 [Streptomyces sp. NPDC059083]|uniref:hypothetical protein n=1 Tax=Streptomyces sp. NPDC059083 TaxID=3346721 RepID=UPI0036C9A698
MSDQHPIHAEPSPLAGQTVLMNFGNGPIEVHIEDWWDRVYGHSWMVADASLAARGYAIRAGLARLPLDNEVLFGHVAGLGNLVHVSEITTAEAVLR